VAKRGAVDVEGEVTALLPHGLVRVRVAAGHDIVAHLDAGRERNFVRVLVDDRVRVQLSPRDPGRGRIVRRMADGE
jgi:translation initiation factor IF-1